MMKRIRLLLGFGICAGVLASSVWIKYSNAIFPLFHQSPPFEEQALDSIEKRLNEVYRSQRPFLYRWPNAPYGSFPNISHRPALEEILGDLDQHVIDHGHTARSRQLQARVEMVTGENDKAISDYQLALLAEPDNHHLQLELGIAFALRAKADQRPFDYELAMQQMLHAARLDSSPETLYDLAALFDEIPLPIQAAKQWSLVIHAEALQDWRRDAETRLKSLERLLLLRQQRLNELKESPEDYLDHSSEIAGALELATDTAIETWLPNASRSRTTLPKLRKLAFLLEKKHHDLWLKDLISPIFFNRQNAFESLAKAWQQNSRGEHIHAAKSAAQALHLFSQHHDVAGELRSRVELAYSYDRRWLPNKCLTALQGIRSVARKHQYKWVEEQAWLEEITCRTETKRAEIIAEREHAYSQISSTGYEGLRLRALSFLTETYVSCDSPLRTWKRGIEGIRSFWNGDLAANRGYTFYYTMAVAARSGGDFEAALALLQEGVDILADFPYTQLRALVLSDLGAWQAELGLHEEATRTFHRMDILFAQLEVPETQKFRMEAEITRAEAYLAAGDPKAALDRLHQLTRHTPFPHVNFGPIQRRRLMPVFGNAYLAAGKLGPAKRYYEQIIDESSGDLEYIRDQAQRDNALHEIGLAWRGLTAVYLRQKKPSKALKIWEHFRGGRFRDSDASIIRPPQGITLLVYAFLPDGLSGWLVNHGSIEQHWIDAASATRAAHRFSLLAGEPAYPASNVSDSARATYNILLEPFSRKLPSQGILVIDADHSLAAIPWSALEDKQGQVLLERFSISQTIGWAEIAPHVQQQTIDFTEALILSEPSLRADLRAEYGLLPDARREAERLRQRFPKSHSFQGPDATFEKLKSYLQHATVFHFAGHGISYGGFGALLLAPSPGDALPVRTVTAEEISQLDLRHLQLVVLAACSSGAGEQSGLVNLDSLARAFLEAGATRVVAARWNINSPETARLMHHFYEGILKHHRPSEALRTAALHARANSPTHHPYDWAGFDIFGTP